jgi:hypothetical protein
MPNRRLLYILFIVVTAAAVAGSAFAAGENGASYFASEGDMYVTNAGSPAEAVAAEDGKFVQLAPGAYMVMKFPDDSLAQPDGTDAADLRVATVDDAFPANAEIFTSMDGTDWTSLGIKEDTTDLEFNLAKPALFVKIDQASHFIDPEYPRYGFDLDAVTALNTEPIRYGEITNPGAGEVVYGSVTFAAALYNDDTDAGVQWAVRFGGCEAGGDTVWGNVDGYTDPFTWDGQSFSSTADTAAWEPGLYCFVFNPREDPGEAAVRETSLFTVVEEEQPEFCEIGWKPPISLENYVLNVKATLPIKFFLADCDGNPLRGEASPELVVQFLGDDQHDETTYPLQLKRGSGGYQFLALFRPEMPGNYKAVVTYKGEDYVQYFEVVEKGNGKDKSQTEEKQNSKDNPGKPEAKPNADKPKGKPEEKPDKKPKKP